MDRKEMGQIIGMAKKAFPNHVLETAALELWFTLFETETAEDFMIAMLSTIKEPGRQFFPTPGEVNKYLQHSRGETMMTAGEAWNLTYSHCLQDERKFFERYGDNHALYVAARQIGLRNIALANIEEELPFLRKEFIRTYEQNKHKAEMQNNFALTHNQAKKMLNSLNGILPDRTKTNLLK